LAGIASSRSVTLGSGGISLVLACDGEGGVCTGNAEMTVPVREELIARRDGRRRTVSTRTRKVTLTTVEFAIAPGASTLVRSSLSSQNRTLLSRLGGGPLDVMLSGRGVAHRVVTLEPAGGG
jgi:hypothetical protein